MVLKHLPSEGVCSKLSMLLLNGADRFLTRTIKLSMYYGVALIDS